MNTYDPEHFCGYPGMVWYSQVTPTRGGELKVGDWLDSLDHCGARTIRAIGEGDGYRTVCFSDIEADSEVVRNDVLYDVVNPASIVAPDGTSIR